VSETPTVVVAARTEKLSTEKAGWGLAELVANNRFFKRNFVVECLRVANPYFPRMWNVDMFFEHAEGRPLYVDIVPVAAWSNLELREQVVNAFVARKKLMKKAGLRYLYIEPDMTLGDALEQMGEL